MMRTIRCLTFLYSSQARSLMTLTRPSLSQMAPMALTAGTVNRLQHPKDANFPSSARLTASQPLQWPFLQIFCRPAHPPLR